MNIARTILDGIVMCAVFNAVVGLFFFVFPQAYSTMFPRGMKKAAKPYVKKDEVIKLYCILIPLYLLMFLYMAASARNAGVSGAFAKEAVLGTLNAVFMGGNSLMEAAFFAKTAKADTAMLGNAMTQVIQPAEALAFMFATTFNIPCLMALSTTYKESHSLKWTVRVALFYICNALILSCIVYHIASLFI